MVALAREFPPLHAQRRNGSGNKVPLGTRPQWNFILSGSCRFGHWSGGCSHTAIAKGLGEAQGHTVQDEEWRVVTSSQVNGYFHLDKRNEHRGQHRPALPNEVARYTDHQRKRLLVKSGITCYWQTRCSRDAITFDEWIDLDL